MSLRERAVVMQQMRETAPFESKDGFEMAQRMAKLIQASSLIEQSGSYDERVANAVILQDLSYTTGISVFGLAKEIYIVHGKIGFSGHFYRGVINRSGEFLHRLRFRFNEARTNCIAYTRDVFDGELLESPPFSIEQAKLEGLYSKSGSKWLTRPDSMLINRVTYMFATMYASHLFIGFGKSFGATGGLELKEDFTDAEIL